mmetsp:Transcript_22408/g.76781  ORF Transcript_22408/g.76781 Transcript_22408/m.76781 type:complete len:200 (-) Transcript_22408:50-649(-)
MKSMQPAKDPAMAPSSSPRTLLPVGRLRATRRPTQTHTTKPAAYRATAGRSSCAFSSLACFSATLCAPLAWPTTVMVEAPDATKATPMTSRQVTASPKISGAKSKFQQTPKPPRGAMTDWGANAKDEASKPATTMQFTKTPVQNKHLACRTPSRVERLIICLPRAPLTVDTNFSNTPMRYSTVAATIAGGRRGRPAPTP